MQSLKEEPFKYRPNLKQIVGMIRFLSRFRSHPEALEPFIASLKKTGAPETNIANVRTLLIAWRDAYRDHEGVYRVDRYLLAGVGAADLVLVAVILPLGVPDRPLFVAQLSLAI